MSRFDELAERVERLRLAGQDRDLQELGLLALPFAEEHGGFAGGPVETMIVMEALGRALALEPFGLGERFASSS